MLTSSSTSALGFVSCYDGDWLLMPVDFLEVVANVCYQFPRPRFVDPAVAYDAFKIRRMVEEAVLLAERADSDSAAPRLTTVNGDSIYDLMPLASNSGRKVKPSAERRFRMRAQAIQKLACAYRLNEAQCMAAAKRLGDPFEGLAEKVLKRLPDDRDSNYVHMFLDNVLLADVDPEIDLQPLDTIIAGSPNEPEYLRTRSRFKMIKGDYDGAIQDLSLAIQACQSYAAGHQSAVLVPNTPHQQPRSRVRLTDQEQPSSLPGQLLVLRGWAYLCAASKQVLAARDIPGGLAQGMQCASHQPNPEPQPESVNFELHRRVKALAKRGLADIMKFLVGLDYSPDLSLTTVQEFSERTEKCEYGTRRTRHTERNVASEPCKCYTVADLFASPPPPDLPTFPPEPESDDAEQTTCEAVTAHPMLAEALHQMLLLHCLLQTSREELQRYACMVARVVRLIDNSPVLYPCGSVARTDWTVLTLRLRSWIKLPDPWEKLCRPVPLLDSPSGMAAVSCQHPAPKGKSSCKNAQKKSTPCCQYSAGAGTPDPQSVPIQQAWDHTHTCSKRAFAIGEWVINAPMVRGRKKIKKRKGGQAKAKDTAGDHKNADEQ
jgi:hypothetical protein